MQIAGRYSAQINSTDFGTTPRPADRSPIKSGTLLSEPRRVVYPWCMARTNVDIDEKACAAVMRRFRLRTKREAINFALRTLAAEPLSVESARKLRGSGWVGDLEAMRTDRVP